MQAIKRTLENIFARLQGLAGTARLLIAALFIILTMSLFVVAQYAGQASLVSLPVRSLTPETEARAIAYLERRNIAHEQRDGRIWVPTEQRFSILSDLQQRELLDADAIDFAALIEEESPFMNREATRRRWMTAKMSVLEQMIARMKGVRSAHIVIDEPQRIGFGKSYIPPTASATIVMKTGEMTQDMVDSIAGLIAGSHAGLQSGHVQITDANANKPRKARNNDELAAGNYLEHKVNTENTVEKKIEQTLTYIPGAIIAVNAMVDTRDTTRRRDIYQEPFQSTSQESSLVATSSNRINSSEPGIRPNTGADITSVAQNGSRSSREEREAELESRYPSEHVLTHDPKGHALKINASIGVPRSYFVQLYNQQNGEQETEPSEADLSPLVARESEIITKSINPLIDTDAAAFSDASRGIVNVYMYQDFAVVQTGNKVGTQKADDWSGGGLMTDSLVKTVGLGSLALISVVMMFLMVRKANVQEELPSAAELAGVPPTIEDTNNDVIGEASEGSLPLEGFELDDATLQRQQMLDQINALVTKSPSDAANLMRRWMRAEA